jgi:ketosteroid isomerase-like protein
MTNQCAIEAGPLRGLIDQFFEAWRGCALDKVLEYFSDDAVVTLLGDGTTLSGKRMVGERWILPMMKRYSDKNHHITSFVEAGNQIVVEWFFTAVHVSTGKQFRLQGCSVYWVSEGLIQRGHVYFQQAPAEQEGSPLAKDSVHPHSHGNRPLLSQDRR